MVKIEPRLLSKFSAPLNTKNAEGSETVRVVVNFKPEQKSLWVVNQTWHKIETVTNQEPNNKRYYENLGVLLIEAPLQYIQKLSEDPKISTIALLQKMISIRSGEGFATILLVSYHFSKIKTLINHTPVENPVKWDFMQRVMQREGL
jgi:hypothetical protein